jgi:hypothetical protein
MILELRQQNETLREAVEAAPHSHGCPNRISGNKFEPGPWQCNCWKAKALNDPGVAVDAAEYLMEPDR